MRAKTSEDLLRDIKARTASANANGLINDQAILDLVNQDLPAEVAHLLIGAKSEYWVRSADQSIVAGQSSYRIPDDSLAMTLHDVVIVENATGNQWSASQQYGNDQYLYASGGAPRGFAPFDFCLQEGQVVLLPEPQTSGLYTLRLRYYGMPSRLVVTSDAARITGATSSTLTLATNPGLDVTEVGSILDIVRGGGMHEPIAQGVTVSAYDSGTRTLTFTPALSDEALASISTTSGYGSRQDWVCLSGETVFPPVPAAMYGAIVALGARALSDVRQDQGGYQTANLAFNQKRNAAIALLTPRVDGQQIKLVPRNTPLRGGSRRRIGWRVR